MATTYQHEHGAVLAFSAPELGRMSSIIRPISLIATNTYQVPRHPYRKLRGTYIDAPPERRYTGTFNIILIYRKNLAVREDVQSLLCDGRKLAKY